MTALTPHSEVTTNGHTPGPWTNVFFDEGETTDIFAGHEGELLATAYPLNRTAGSPLQNARLIAAAPEMFELLHEFAAILKSGCPIMPEVFDQITNDLVAKARGRR
jgi:hypothetical protein